ncbi:MAG: LytTR family transcriptional regulator [Dysgonamonadaceae bacterium]|jgi:DNA-binding LytR/AlgR family response regulator|nr:LytTR family transcriptional regulator [Dysgonamonadaceae bacterium]
MKKKGKIDECEHGIHIYFVKSGECRQQVMRIHAIDKDEIINRLLQICTGEGISVQLTTTRECGYKLSPIDNEDLYVWDNGKLVQIRMNEIVYLEASRCYCEIHTANGERTVTSMPLNEVEKHLPDDRFIRIHRSFTVNRRYVKEISGNLVLLPDGKKLSVGREHRKTLMDSLNIINTQNKKYFP